MIKMKIWDCRIIVPADTDLPNGFDYPPRSAAIEAVQNAGIEVVGCSSGWGGTPSKKDEIIVQLQERNAELEKECSEMEDVISLLNAAVMSPPPKRRE